MLNSIKIGVFIFVTAFLFGFIFCGELSAKTIPTPDQYEEYLEEQGDPESLELKKQFSKLPQRKKQKILKYFFDPEVMKNIYSQDTASDSKKVLYNGDVVIENKTTLTEKDVEEDSPSQTTGSYLSSFLFGNVFAAPTIKEYSANNVKEISVAGTWIKYNISIKYRVKNGKIIKIFYGGATVSKFLWLPLVTKKSFTKYITVSNNRAHGVAVWETAIPVLKNNFFDLSPMAGNRHHEVHGYSTGKVTHSFWEE